MPFRYRNEEYVLLWNEKPPFRAFLHYVHHAICVLKAAKAVRHYAEKT